MALLFDDPIPRVRFTVSENTVDMMCGHLLNKDLEIVERFKAFSLRSVGGSSPHKAFAKAMRDPSILLAYTAAFELGRMKEFDSIPALKDALRNTNLDPIVRHKAAESLGTFRHKEVVVPIFEDFLASDPPAPELVRETCECALSRQEELYMPASYYSDGSITQLREILLDEEDDIHDRFFALFALQKLGTEDAISAIFDCIASSKSTLLRDGVTYVLCLLNNERARSELSHILHNTSENTLLRLQAANFFGGTEDACIMHVDENFLTLLKNFIEDDDAIVAQCCQVAVARLTALRSLELYEMDPSMSSESRSLIQTSTEKEKFLCDLLLDKSQPICERFRAFSLSGLTTCATFSALITAMWDASSLLAYNAAYTLSLMKNEHFIPAFVDALTDLSLHPIVRHKAAEALGVFGFKDLVRTLHSSMLLDPDQAVQETCELAILRIRKLEKAWPLYSGSFFMSDPAVPLSCPSIPILSAALLDENKDMYHRHAALFGLAFFPKKNDEEIIPVLFEALDTDCILLRHWVVSVLSRRRSRRSIDVLCKILSDTSEHTLVRQQAVQGLVPIIKDDPDVLRMLDTHANSNRDFLVSERCKVALKMIECNMLGEPFQHKLKIEDLKIVRVKVPEIDAPEELAIRKYQQDKMSKCAAGVDPKRQKIV